VTLPRAFPVIYRYDGSIGSLGPQLSRYCKKTTDNYRHDGNMSSIYSDIIQPDAIII
jgi:hypothetical protein